MIRSWKVHISALQGSLLLKGSSDFCGSRKNKPVLERKPEVGRLKLQNLVKKSGAMFVYGRKYIIRVCMALNIPKFLVCLGLVHLFKIMLIAPLLEVFFFLLCLKFLRTPLEEGSFNTLGITKIKTFVYNHKNLNSLPLRKWDTWSPS